MHDPRYDNLSASIDAALAAIPTDTPGDTIFDSGLGISWIDGLPLDAIPDTIWWKSLDATGVDVWQRRTNLLKARNKSSHSHKLEGPTSA